MGSLAKLEQIKRPKYQRDFSHITNPESFREYLSTTSHEKRSSQIPLQSKNLTRIPTVAEYKAIINSNQCPLEDILTKAPQILRNEVKRLIAALPQIREPFLQNATLKNQAPSEFRKKTCFGCKSLEKQKTKKTSIPALTKKVQQPKLKRPKLGFHSNINSKKKNQSSAETRKFTFDENEYRRMHGIVNDKETAKNGEEKSDHEDFYSLIPDEPDFLYKMAGGASKNSLAESVKSNMSSINSALEYYLTQTSNLGKDLSKIQQPTQSRKILSGNIVSKASMKYIQSQKKLTEEEEKVIVINGLPVSFNKNHTHNFTHWFGDESMLIPKAKKAHYDARGFVNDQIEIKLRDKNKLDITGIHKTHFPGNPQRKKFIGTFIIPKPDLLAQYQICRTKSGHLIIEKKPGGTARKSNKLDQSQPSDDVHIGLDSSSSKSLTLSDRELTELPILPEPPTSAIIPPNKKKSIDLKKNNVNSSNPTEAISRPSSGVAISYIQSIASLENFLKAYMNSN